MTLSEPPKHDLRSSLAPLLPLDIKFHIFHISTPPCKTDALCSAPPKQRPDRTYCEKHFLAVAIDEPQGGQISATEAPSTRRKLLVLGIEILLYTTAYSTTLFVAKADSTGCLDVLKLPQGTPSPIRGICTAFLQFLVDRRRRKGVQFVVNLFARSQAQYLFPGSVESSGKHILDDRQLVKWWAKVLSPLLESTASWRSARGYLVIPGLEASETRAFIPSATRNVWTLGDPLRSLSRFSSDNSNELPPRCLIPQFPDDPKCRFRNELDEEAAGSGALQKRGKWKSVPTLEMFWEMMAFRQECSSGRLTGFIWLVLEEQTVANDSAALMNDPTNRSTRTEGSHPKSASSKPLAETNVNTKLELKAKRGKKNDKQKSRLKGRIIPRQPKIKTKVRNYSLDIPTSTPYYSWPLEGRGDKIVDDADYKRTIELLLHLDFATLEKAANSSKRWLEETEMWDADAYSVIGKLETPTSATLQANEPSKIINNLSGLVKRKRPDPVKG